MPRTEAPRGAGPRLPQEEADKRGVVGDGRPARRGAPRSDNDIWGGIVLQSC